MAVLGRAEIDVSRRRHRRFVGERVEHLNLANVDLRTIASRSALVGMACSISRSAGCRQLDTYSSNGVSFLENPGLSSKCTRAGGKVRTVDEVVNSDRARRVRLNHRQLRLG